MEGPRSGLWARHERATQAVALVALSLGLGYLGWRVGWSLRGVDPLLGWTLLGAEAFGWVSLAFYAFLAWSVPKSLRPPPLRDVSVDVFVCTYDEPISVVEATLVGCRAIPTPHLTYLLDDGRRPEMAALADRLGARYVTRPTNEHAKAGNVNHALGVSDGELILVLDADHVPLPEILEATTGYFADPEVALVQTPHEFSNRDSVQHSNLARHEQSLFYQVIAPGKDRHNAMFWCGSAAVIRRRALADVGGLLTDTVAEDFHTSIALHARGWRTRYHDEVLVQGLAPHDLGAFLLQRARWARGNLAVFRTKENPLTCPGLTAKQRCSYFASLFNYFSGLQRLALLVVLMVTLGTGTLPMRADPWVLAALWLPWSVTAFVATTALGRGTLGPLDSSRYGLLTMGVSLRGVASMVVKRAGTFKVTPKEGTDPGGVRVLRLEGLLTAVGVALVIVWSLRVLGVIEVIAMPPMPAFAAAVAIGLGAWELFCVGAALVPLVRRRQRRVDYRVPVTMQGRIAGTMLRVQIVDVTPSGLAFEGEVDCRVGTHLTMLTRVIDASLALHDVALPLEVRSCVPLGTDGEGAEPSARWRIGCRIGEVDLATHQLLVEFCEVALPTRRPGHDTGSSPEPSIAAMSA